MPPVAASPNAWLSRSRCELRQPPSNWMVCASGSTLEPVIVDRSITRPSSHRAWPATACPPPRTEGLSSCSRPKRTAAITSATPEQRAMSAGRRWMCPFQILRTSSYVGSSGWISCPWKLAAKPSMAALSIDVMRSPPRPKKTAGAKGAGGPRPPRRSPGRPVDEAVGGHREVVVEPLPKLGLEIGVVERRGHRRHPSVALALPDRERRVAHAQAGMAASIAVRRGAHPSTGQGTTRGAPPAGRGRRDTAVAA